MKKLLSLFILMLSPMLASADVVEIDGIYYDLSSYNKTAEVTSKPNKYSGDVVIPDIVFYNDVTYDITSIGKEAFLDCGDLVSVTIPNTVIAILDHAFTGCKSLTGVTIPNSVKYINWGAFGECASLASISIPNSVTSIAPNMFEKCYSLTSIIIPNSIISIGAWAFRDCSSLSSIDIPETVEEIGEGAFSGCKQLKTVRSFIGEPFEISENAFSGSTSAAILYVPKGTIEKYKSAKGWMVFKEIVEMAVQDDYRPFVEEGKVWTYHYYNDMTGKDFYESLMVSGDTVVDDKSYKKIVDVTTGRVDCAIREEGRKVYATYPHYSGEKLIYDFGLNVGDAFQLYDDNNGSDPNAWATVVSVDTIVVGSRAFRALDVRSNDMKGWPNWWVEGIGGKYGLTENCLLPGNSYCFSSCKLGEDTLFTNHDFQTLGTVPSPEKVIPMVQEGRTWNVVTINPADPAETDPASYYDILGRKGRVWNRTSYVIDGDTVIGGVTYKKLLSNGNVVCGMREENGRVYGCGWSWAPSSEKLLYDFNAQPGDVFKNDDENIMVQVKCVRQVNINGQSRRCLEMRHYVVDEKGEEHYGGFADYWIEGIGSTGYPDNPFWWDIIGNYPLLLSCYDGDKCIFTCDDFNDLKNPKPDVNIAYRPFVEEDKVWKVGSTTGISDGIVKMVDYYYFDGDTIINGKTCKQMMCQRYVSPDYSDDDYMSPSPSLSRVGAWYEEDKKVYFYDERKQSMVLKYDFSIGDNESLQLIDDYLPFIIGPKQTGELEGFKGVYRDVMINQDVRITTWLEGVGGIDGPTRNAYPEAADRMPEFLMSCTVGDEVIYLNDEYEDGATPEAARKDRIDFTHTIKIKPKSRTAREAEAKSLYGEYNSQQLGLNLNALDEAYQVSITDEAGKAVYEKTVNAGSIVGLNIDISAYAKGRYTVTVENSNESFTGEIDTRTTGISDAERLNDNGEMINDNIYNLQGQRISSLRKGLNIVRSAKGRLQSKNGRKVVVR